MSIFKSEKSRKRVIATVITFVVLAILSFGLFAYATQDVKIEVTQMPNIDIVLTKNQTEANLESFESDLKAEIVKKGIMSQSEIDNGKINVSAIKTETVETQESFQWNQSVSSKIGSVSFTNNGKNVTMAGNSSYAGKNAIWIIPDKNQEQNFEFQYNINFGDSFNAAGMLLRVQENTDGTLEGYMLSFNNSSWVSSANGKNGALWHFKYDKNNSVAFKKGTDIQLITGLNINKSGTLKVNVDDTAITINGGGLSSEYVYNYEKGKSYGIGYGFFSDHYSHGCDQVGSFQLSNINLQTQTVKKLTEVLQEPEWREGSTRILVDVRDNDDEEISDNSELNALIAKLMNNDIYYIGWGTDNNKEQMQNLINQNDGKGTFVENTSDSAINATVDYIKGIAKAPSTNTVIAGESVNVKVTSPIGGVETPTETFPNGVWKVEHDYNYYENPQGQYQYDGMYTNDLINSFSNVGKYSIYCEDKLVKEIYAHRRPVAAFNMVNNGQELSLKSVSYDLDIEKQADNYEEQKANNGIKAEKWEYKKVDSEDNSWKEIVGNGNIGEAVTADLDENTEYMIRLTVTDYQGVESSSIKYITTQESVEKPIASFKIVKKEIYKEEDLKIIDESYDPSGKELTYNWKVEKIGENSKTQVYEGTEPLLNFSEKTNSNYGVGTYRISLVVSKMFNNQKIESKEFAQTIEVTIDKTAPEIIVTPTSATSRNDDINVNVNIQDNESGVKSYKYAITESSEKANEDEWSDEINVNDKTFTGTVTIPKNLADKKLYLHIKATNEDGVESEERISGTYYIEPTYDISLQVIDSENGANVKNVVFNIVGEYADGSRVEIATNVTTDKNGKIFVEKAALKDVEKIRVENVEATTGYEKAELKSIKIDTSTFKVVVDSSKTSPDIETAVTEDGQELQLKVKLQRAKYDFTITNVDSNGNIYIAGTEFVLKQNGKEVAKGTTGTDGKVTLNPIIGGFDTNVEYVLEQTKISEDYKNIGTTVLKVTFDKNGNVSSMSQKLFSSNNAVEIPDKAKSEVIVKNERDDSSDFTVKINVKDGTTKKVLEGSKYKIYIEGTDGLNYSTEEKTTDKSGNITVSGLYGKGLIKLTFVQTEAPNGYAVETTNRYITINKDNDGKMVYTNDSMAGVLNKIDNENKTIYVNLSNYKKTEENVIKVKMVDENNKEVGVEGANLKVYRSIDDALIGTGTTDENGEFEISNVISDGTGEILYEIVSEDKTLNKKILFIAKYDANKLISGAEKVSSKDNINVSYEENDEGSTYKHIAYVEIGSESKEITGINTVSINSISAIDGSKMQDVKYKVRIAGDTTTAVTDMLNTDANGKIETKIPTDKKISIQLTQVTTPEGYKVDTQTKTIVLKKQSNNKLAVLSTNNISAGSVSVDDNGNININDIIKSNKVSEVKFKLATTNMYNTLNLGGATYRITEPTTGYSEEVTTDANGYITTENSFYATQGISYEFEIEQLSAIAPYKIPSKTIKMELLFTKVGQVVKYDNILYIDGTDIISDKNTEYDSENNEVSVSIKVKNESENDYDYGVMYDLDIRKENSNGEIVEGSKYDIEIRPYAQSNIISKNKAITNDIEVENLAIKQDKTTILLKEVNSAIGYGLDSKIKVLTLQLNAEGNLEYVPDTTAEDLKVTIKDREVNGINKKVVEVVIIAKEATEEPEPNVPDTKPDEDTKPTEERPENSTVALRLFNKSAGDWNRTYNERSSFTGTVTYYYGKYGFHYSHKYENAIYNNKTITYKLAGAQKLERIFKNSSDSINHNFNFITGNNETIETRLIENGKTSDEIYETAKSLANTNVNDKNGTDSIYLYKDYKNKTVEVTLKEDKATIDYLRNTTDTKFIVKFDENGKVKSGSFIQGQDLEEVAIGGISADGITQDIQYLEEDLYKTTSSYKYINRIQGETNKKTYSTGDIKDYNSIGQDTLYIGILNKETDNRLQFKVKLEDEDGNAKLDGEANVAVYEKQEDGTYKTVETNNIIVKDGVGTINLQHAYQERYLRFVVAQTEESKANGHKYINRIGKNVKFDVTTDENCQVKDYMAIDVPENAQVNIADKDTIECTIYNDIDYNFALNITKQDENGKPLQGVKLQGISAYLKNASTGESVNVFSNISAKTNENGQAKLKLKLPETGEYNYYNSIMEITLNETYVPDNYKAVQGLKVRVIFDENGMVKNTEVVQANEENELKITGSNNITDEQIEKSSVDISLKNTQIQEKPTLEITNMDVNNNDVKLSGTKYKVTVWDEEEYAKNLTINETRFSRETDTEGKTKIEFENSHALRTIIYRIQEITPSQSYVANNDILLKVKYDKDGKIVSKPERMTSQKLYNKNNNEVETAEIDGNPVGSMAIKLNIVNQVSPRFTIRVRRVDSNGDEQNKKEFKATSQVKEEDGSLGETTEERISNETKEGSTKLEFRNAYPNKTVVYTISEKTGNTYTERGKIEVSFDEYGNVIEGSNSGKYISNASFAQGQKNAKVTIVAEKFVIKMNLVCKDSSVTYSKAGGTFNIVNSKGEVCNTNTTTNSVGTVNEIIGEVYKGETIRYEVNQIRGAEDYNDVKAFTFEVTFDDNGNITSCTPNSEEDVYDVVTTERNVDNKSNMELNAYVTSAKRNSLKINVFDYEDETKNIKDYTYEIKTSINENKKDIIMPDMDGNGIFDLGSYKKYCGKTVQYTIEQKTTEEKYQVNTQKVQISVTYDENGTITEARLLSTDGYITINEEETIGNDTVSLTTKNKRKVAMKLYNVSSEREEDVVAGAQFVVLQNNSVTTYSDTKTTDTNGEASLYVGPFYENEEVDYEIRNSVSGFGFDTIPNIEFKLIYDEDGNVVSYNIAEENKKYLDIEIPDKKSELYGNYNVKLKVKSDPLFTVGVKAIDNSTGDALTGGKYEIKQTDDTNKTGTAVTKTENIGHASIGKTEPGKTVSYTITEKTAPIGYKYLNKDGIVGTITVSYDGDGRIIPGSASISSNYNIEILQDTDKLNTFDIDVKIPYEEIDEFKIIVENESAIDSSEKIQSQFNAQLTEGQSATVTTDADTGLGLLNFGSIKVTNSKQKLVITQSMNQDKYVTISNIAMNISFDESGKIKDLSSISGTEYATEGEAYVIEARGAYTLKVKVKNNPQTKLKIASVSDGDVEEPVESNFNITGQGIDKAININTKDGNAETALPSISANAIVDYTIAQNSVDKGYKLNKNIILRVKYDNNKKISNAYIVTNQSTADSSVVEITNTTEYAVELKIKNKQEFRIYVNAEDMYDSSKKLSNLQINMKEATYSKESVTLVTDENGEANTKLGATVANSYLDYDVKLLTVPDGYYKETSVVQGTIRVFFGNNGEVVDCQSSSEQLNVTYGSGLAVEITAKYIPTVNMKITRRNTTDNTALNGRTISVTSAQMLKGQQTLTTDNNGRISLDAGRIEVATRVEYTINEKTTGYDTNIKELPELKVYITYDSLGVISNIEVSNTEIMTATGIGTREISVVIGSNKQVSLALINSDYYNSTNSLTGTYEITSEKGDVVTATADSKATKIVELGIAYPGKSVKYSIRQTQTQSGYETISNQIFTVTYSENGSIEKVEAEDADKLNIKQINQSNSRTQANIVIEIKSRAAFNVKLNLKDSQYNQGIYGLKFKITNEKTGQEINTEITNEDGILEVQPGAVGQNEHIKYKIEQTETLGGYKEIEPIEFVVEYGDMGTVVENGTYIINNENAKITSGYSEKLYKNSKKIGVEISAETRSDMGIGIVNIDANGNKISGVEFTTIQKNVETEETEGWKVATNENGEIVNYIGELPKAKVMEYTISQVQAPAGFRKNEDITLRVYFGDDGRIRSYTTDKNISNIKVEVATDKLIKMDDSKETVHIKLTIVSDNRLTFKIVNKDEKTGSFIKDSEFTVSVETTEGIIESKDISTNLNGEALLEGINANGTIKIFFNQIKTGDNYEQNAVNSGYITLEKNSTVYDIAYKDSTDNLEYDIDNENGIVTIYLLNSNYLKMNITDINLNTNEVALNGSHAIKAQYGDKNEEMNDILNKQDNIVEYNNSNGYQTEEGKISANLGSTYDFSDKKVVYTISTATIPDNSETNEKFEAIGDIHVIVEFDKEGRISSINGKSTRILALKNSNYYTIDLMIGFGDNTNYSVKIIKEAENKDIRVNGTKFNINLLQNDSKVMEYNDQITGEYSIGDTVIEDGVIKLDKLEYEGKIKLEINETEAAEGYINNSPNTNVEFNVSLNREDTENPVLKVSNINSSEGIKTSVDELTREISITITDKAIMKLNITKTDEYGNLINGVKFGVTIRSDKDYNKVIDCGTLTTDEYGKIENVIENTFKDETIIITLMEEENEVYNKINPIVIEAHINEKGQIDADSAKIVSSSSNAELTNKTAEAIDISIINVISDSQSTYKINILKTDSEDKNTVLSGVLFQVKIKPEVGTTVYKVASTNEDGELEIGGLFGSGTIKVEAKEIKAPEGYKLGDNNGYFSYEFLREKDVLKLANNNTYDNKLSIDNNNNCVNIQIENTKDNVELIINKIDNQNELGISGTELKLTNVDNGKEYTATTNEKGQASFKLDSSESKLETYKLVETKASEGYLIDETPKTINIQYNENNEIESTTESNGIEKIDQGNKFVKYTFKNAKAENEIQPYNVKLINVDAENNTIGIKDSEFSVKINQENGPQNLYLKDTTNDKGEMNIENITGSGDISISITNTKAGDGYILNKQNMLLRARKNANNGRIIILENNNVSSEYDEENNTIKIYVSSKKEESKYTLVVNTIDKETGDLITNKNGKLKININGEETEKEIDSQGRVVLQGLSIPDVEKLSINIDETEAPESYINIEEQQKINATISSIYDSKIIKTIETEGNSIQKVNSSNTEIIVNLLHEKNKEEIPEEELYLKTEDYLIGNTKEYTEGDKYISKVKPYVSKYHEDRTTVDTFKNNISTNADSIEVFDINGKEVKGNSLIGTNMQLKLTKGTQNIVLTIVVTGDTNGDGKITVGDSSAIVNHSKGKITLVGAYLEAADTNYDGQVTVEDKSVLTNVRLNLEKDF